MKTKLFNYFVYTGLLSHLLFVVLFLWQPRLVGKLIELPISYYYNKSAEHDLSKIAHITRQPIEQQIAQVFKPWKPFYNPTNKKQRVEVNGVQFDTLTKAIKSLKSGDELALYDGVFNTPFAIDVNDVSILGFGHVVFEKASFRGKAYIVSKAKNLTVKNIECRFISVSDNNGACIRQEGQGLTLDHVYFHHSENGILESSKHPGNIYIGDSRFELLGRAGQAHAIYSNTANLYIENSLFIASKDEGHAIKNRSKETYISNSIITSMSSDDSRLIDLSNGGKLTVTRSLLHQGPLSVNGQAIGFGLEGLKHKTNNITISASVIILERIKKNVLLATPNNGDTEINIHDNVIIGKDDLNKYKDNVYFENREEVSYPLFPYFPKQFCQLMQPCPLVGY